MQNKTQNSTQKRTDKLLYKVGSYVPDMVVNHIIIIELKAKPSLHKNDIEQFWHYLKNSKYRLGFLVNFGQPNGVRILRRVYDLARRKP